MITRAQMPRQLRDRGGIMTIKTVRQKYGLGDFVRKIIPNELARVAEIAAPIVAIANPALAPFAAVAGGLGRYDRTGDLGSSALYGAGVQFAGAASPGFESLGTKGATTFGSGITKNILLGKEGGTSLFKDKGLFGAAGEFGLKEAIGGGTPGVFLGTTALSLLGQKLVGPKREDESEEEYLQRRKTAVGNYLRRYYSNLNPTASATDVEAFVQRNTVDYKAEGGIARLGYQTGDLVDPRMRKSLAENVREQQAARERNQGLRAAALLSQAKRLTGPTTRLYSGTTSPTPFGGSKFFATPDLATAKTYATSGPLRGSSFAGPVTGRILQADVPTAQAQNLLKRGLTGTREVVLDPQAAKTLFETGRGALEGSASLGTRAALGATKALPVVGGAATLADASSRAREGDYVGAVLGAAGAVPGLGLPALGTQVVYDVAKNNPIVQEIGTSIGEGVFDLLNPEAEAATPTFEPATQGLIPGFTKVGDRSYQGPDGQIYGPETYASIAAGGYPDIYDPNKTGPSRKEIVQRILKEIEPTFESASEANPNMFATGLDVDYLKTLTPEEIKMELDNAFLQGENFEDSDFTTGRIGGGRPFFRYDPEYMEKFNMSGPALQLSTPGIGYNLRNQLGELETILGKEAIKPYKTKVDDALIDFYKTQQTADADLQKRIFGLKKGGIIDVPIRTNSEGVRELDYRKTGGFVPIGVKEKADDVPAMLSLNEFVMTADAVRGAGDGNIEKGAQRMYDTMKKLESRVE